MEEEVVEGVGEEGAVTKGRGRAPVLPPRHARVAMLPGARSTPWRGGAPSDQREGGRGGGATGPKGGGEERACCQT